MKQEVKTSIEGLRVGMFVSRLDRPWIQTPFTLQGVHIESPKDIERLRTYCSYVFVDVEQGPAPDPRYWMLQGKAATQTYRSPQKNKRPAAPKDESRNELLQLRKTTYRDTQDIDTELEQAEAASSTIARNLGQILTDLRQGRNLDLELVKAGIDAMVYSIIRNPSAMMWVTQLKKLDEYTYSRALGTSVWCATFARHLGLEKDTIYLLALGGLVLDLGKSRLPLALLKKKGRLDPQEMKRMHSHVDLGVKVLVTASRRSKGQSLPADLLQMVATHHEREDGSGYPQGLNNGRIPVFGRIAGIVDAYDAMTSICPYANDNRPKTPHEAISELYELRGSKFQAELVEQFIQTVGLYPTGSLVELHTGEVAVVVATNGLRRLRPTVMLLLDKNKYPLPEFRHLDLSKVDEHIKVDRGLPSGAYGIDMRELFL